MTTSAGETNHAHAYIAGGVFAHHAHVIEAVGEQAVDIIAAIRALEHAAIDVLQEESLLIDHVRELQRKQQLRAVGKDVKVFVVHVSTLQHEAQHALLKLIEEPTEKTYFFFIVPSVSLLLPTVVSRLFNLGPNVRVAGGANNEFARISNQFLKSTIPERLKLIAPLYEADQPAGGKQATQAFVYALLDQLRANGVYADPALYARCLRLAEYANDKASSSKMIVECLAFLIPYPYGI